MKKFHKVTPEEPEEEEELEEKEKEPETDETLVEVTSEELVEVIPEEEKKEDMLRRFAAEIKRRTNFPLSDEIVEQTIEDFEKEF